MIDPVHVFELMDKGGGVLFNTIVLACIQFGNDDAIVVGFFVRMLSEGDNVMYYFLLPFPIMFK